jgi:hypothetical protein
MSPLDEWSKIEFSTHTAVGYVFMKLILVSTLVVFLNQN